MPRRLAHRGIALSVVAMIGGACVDLARPLVADAGSPDRPVEETHDGGGGVGGDAEAGTEADTEADAQADADAVEVSPEVSDDVRTCVSATPDPCFPYACGSAGSCRTSCSSAMDCAAPSGCFTGICGGLTATYFDNDDFTGPSVTRVDRNVDFDWGNGSPAATLDNDSFSARWTGRLTPRFSDNYTFYVFSDDGVRLWIDDILVIDDFRVHGVTEVSGVVPLAGGKSVSFKMEYFDSSQRAIVRLSWYSPQQLREIVPVGALTP